MTGPDKDAPERTFVDDVLRCQSEGMPLYKKSIPLCHAIVNGTIGLGSASGTAEFDDVVVTDLTTYPLTVSSSGTGTGLVTSSLEGITCGSTCSAEFTLGTVVTLTTAAIGDSVFAGWSGAGAVTSSPPGINCGDTCNYGPLSGTKGLDQNHNLTGVTIFNSLAWDNPVTAGLTSSGFAHALWTVLALGPGVTQPHARDGCRSHRPDDQAGNSYPLLTTPRANNTKGTKQISPITAMTMTSAAAKGALVSSGWSSRKRMRAIKSMLAWKSRPSAAT